MQLGSTVKTTLLLGLLTGLLVLIGSAIGGTGGMIIAFFIAMLMNLGAWWFSDSIALRISGAREVNPEEAPGLHQLVAALAERAALPKPRVFLIESAAPNAFATGRSPEKGAVAVTTGSMNILTHEELAGVIAHELAHIKNRDTLVASVAATIAGAIGMIADMAMWALMFGGLGGGDDDEGAAGAVGGLLTLILAPIIAVLIQLAISRAREYGADEGGARIVGNPEPLARALEKLEGWMLTRPDQPAQVNPGTAHLYIVNPLTGTGLIGLFRTHPPTAERVARLRALTPALSWRQSRAVL